MVRTPQIPGVMATAPTGLGSLRTTAVLSEILEVGVTGHVCGAVSGRCGCSSAWRAAQQSSQGVSWESLPPISPFNGAPA